MEVTGDGGPQRLPHRTPPCRDWTWVLGGISLIVLWASGLGVCCLHCQARREVTRGGATFHLPRFSFRTVNVVRLSFLLFTAHRLFLFYPTPSSETSPRLFVLQKLEGIERLLDLSCQTRPLGGGCFSKEGFPKWPSSYRWG